MTYLFQKTTLDKKEVTPLSVGDRLDLDVVKIRIDDFFNLGISVDYFDGMDEEGLFATEKHCQLTGRVVSIHEVWHQGDQRHLFGVLTTSTMPECSKDGYRFEGYLFNLDLSA